jgi:hypothetical protein
VAQTPSAIGSFFSLIDPMKLNGDSLRDRKQTQFRAPVRSLRSRVSHVGRLSRCRDGRRPDVALRQRLLLLRASPLHGVHDEQPYSDYDEREDGEPDQRPSPMPRPTSDNDAA